MKIRLYKIFISGGIFILSLILFEAFKIDNFYLELSLYLSAFLIIGGDVIFYAVKNIVRGKFLDENFLMGIATIGAFIIGEFPEAVAVMLFYQVGELFQSYAVDKSRKSIASLMDIRPDYANVKQADNIIKKQPQDVNMGDIIIVRAGEKIPLDGIVIEGFSMLDTSALTGEAVPREVNTGDEVLSGCINLSGLLSIRVTKSFGQSTVNKILELVQNASSKKSKAENFITKFARYYTPAVVIIAALLSFIPPLLIPDAAFTEWIYRALTFLVVSCPCALVVSIPMSFFAGIGGAAKNGILIKGGNYLDALNKTETVVFDKTGTLTKGVFKVQKIVPSNNISLEELLEKAAYVQYYSNHPVSVSIKRAYKNEIDTSRMSDFKEMAGLGVCAKVDKILIIAGNAKLMRQYGFDYSADDVLQTTVHIAIGDKYAGYILISDEIKEDSFNAIKQLKDAGIKQTVMLTGDLDKVGKDTASKLNIDKVYTELLPADKVDVLQELLKDSSKNVAYAGDGINDAPVLARADVGIAMGGLGSDAAIEAADIVIMNDEPSKIALAKKIAKKTTLIAKQNIVFALIVKAAVLALSAVGLADMWLAVFADVGVSLLAVLNALRALKI